MTMCCTKRLLLFVLLLSVSPTIWAQKNLTAYLQPQIAVNYKIAGSYSQNFSLASRNYIFSNEDFLLRARQLDLAHFSNLNIRDNQSIALGVQYRFRNNFEDKENELRTTQQYNIAQRPNAIRYGHRIRAEQRITQSLTTHRFRYRYAMDFPLIGEKLDLGEPYFVGSLENLLSVAKGTSPQYDTRLSGQVGWQLQGGLKLQMGIEYRLEDYSSSLPQNILFLLTSMQLSL
ncbi:hypothetical protein MACH07_09300 [Flagellimonas marinaquae]|jgi:hypothetical protein|uniref:DUF2490 domain-containing protein n=2 Tax=Flagellimonas marinaquae TaxID=254955 RepID=A0AA48HH28_9FLAO|nr:hypothetical protein MACH07_09300 [Allomuricauda aquimarina]